MSLTLEQQAANAVTHEHIHTVQKYMNIIVAALQERALNHDRSKLESPEVEHFAAHTFKLAETTYGDQQYVDFTKHPAVQHHYARNRHHPEHFPDGINDMNLLDLIEMFCDWKAAGERQNNGNIRTSIEKNANRFGISPQLVRIFENTIEVLDP